MTSQWQHVFHQCHEILGTYYTCELWSAYYSEEFLMVPLSFL